MTTLFNVDIDKEISDYEESYCTSSDKFKKEYSEIRDQFWTKSLHKLDDYHKHLIRLASQKEKIEETNSVIQNISEKIKQEEQLIESDRCRIEFVKNECKSLELQESQLKCKLNETKEKLDEVIQEKKLTIKKLKRGIRQFKFGVDLYESVLQLSMKIVNKGQNDEIHITMNKLNDPTNYTIIFEECDSKCLELIDIIPHSQSSIKSAELFRINKDFHRLLAVLWGDNKRNSFK